MIYYRYITTMENISASSKIKICKCGHNRKDHKEKPNSKLSFPNDCKKCKCSKYMNRKLPNKVSFGMLIYGFIIIGLLVFLSVNLILDTYQSWDKQIKISISDFVEIVLSLVLIASLLIGEYSISLYFNEKKRKSYPIEDELK